MSFCSAKFSPRADDFDWGNFWGYEQTKLRASRNPPNRAPDRMRGSDYVNDVICKLAWRFRTGEETIAKLRMTVWAPPLIHSQQSWITIGQNNRVSTSSPQQEILICAATLLSIFHTLSCHLAVACGRYHGNMNTWTPKAVTTKFSVTPQTVKILARMAEIIKHDRYFPQLHKWVFPQQKSSARGENFAEQSDVHATLLSIFLSVCGGLDNFLTNWPTVGSLKS